MISYSQVKIGEIADVKGGKRLPKGHELVLFETKHPYIRARDIKGGKVTYDDPVYLTEETHDKIRKYIANKNNVCITIVGANVGDVGIIPQKLDGANLTENAVKLIGKTNDYVAKYVLFALLGGGPQKQMKNFAAGAAQPKLGIYKINEVLIPYPAKAEREKIATILSTYDDLIENNTRRIKILEEMAQAIYREWFVNFRFPGHEKVKMVDSSLGEIPEGWEVKELGDIAHEVRRSIDPANVEPETPYVGLEHIPRKSITLGDWGFAKNIQSTKLAFNKGEILFGKIRPYFHKVSVAPLEGICSSDTIVILTREPRYKHVVLGCVSSTEFVSYATQTSQGTKMPRANWKVLVKYPVIVPQNQTLDQFNTFMDNVVRQTQNLMFKNRNLRQTRDLLLPKLISGEVDVSKVEVGIKIA